MASLHYRPWGLLDWVLDRSPSLTWDLFGCLGTEERSLAVARRLRERVGLATETIIRIENPSPSRYESETREAYEKRTREYKEIGGDPDKVIVQDLLQRYGETIVRVEECVKKCSGNILLDVTSLPKRFFFLALKRFLCNGYVRNLMVTYAIPKIYYKGMLSENFAAWAPLPMFGGHDELKTPEMMIVGVGFSPMGLRDETSQDDGGIPIKLLFPFPAPADPVRRAWRFIQELQKQRRPDRFEIFRIATNDVPGAFDRICSLTNGGKKGAIFAPYGPKPISVAMCLYAHLTESEVFYTQPRVYRPDYTQGVAYVKDKPKICAYWVRMNGRDLYELPTGDAESG